MSGQVKNLQLGGLLGGAGVFQVPVANFRVFLIHNVKKKCSFKHQVKHSMITREK